MNSIKEIIEALPETERENFNFLCLDYRESVWQQQQANLAGVPVSRYQFAPHRSEYHNKIMEIVAGIMGEQTPQRGVVREWIMHERFSIEIVREWEEDRGILRR